MVTVIIRRTDEPKVIQMTQTDLARQLSQIDGAEIMLEDDWRMGLRKVRTPYVSIVEPDSVFSANYYSSNVGLILKAHKKVGNSSATQLGGGGYQRLAMIASCLGVRTYAERIYAYNLGMVDSDPGTNITSDNEKITMKIPGVVPDSKKRGDKLYHVQIGFAPGAIIRTSAIKEIIDDDLWREDDLVKLSTALSLYLWGTGRRIEVNPNTTYVSLSQNLTKPNLFPLNVPDGVATIFEKELIGMM